MIIGLVMIIRYGGGKSLTTWLYNNAQGEIFFEGTPLYHKNFSAARFNHKEFYKWMNEYEPHWIRIISIEKAQQWLHAAEKWIAQMEGVFKKEYDIKNK